MGRPLRILRISMKPCRILPKGKPPDIMNKKESKVENTLWIRRPEKHCIS